MKPKYTLVVIDMQPAFDAAEEILGRVHRRVVVARDRGCPVLFVEYGLTYSSDRTFPELLDAAKGTKFAKVLKVSDNGAATIHEHLRRRYSWPRNLHVCGVNTNACVISTVEGLYLDYHPKYKVTVLEDSCGTVSLSDHRWAISKMTGYAKVEY